MTGHPYPLGTTIRLKVEVASSVRSWHIHKIGTLGHIVDLKEESYYVKITTVGEGDDNAIMRATVPWSETLILFTYEFTEEKGLK